MSAEERSETYRANNLPGVVDHGDGLFERHLDLAVCVPRSRVDM